MRARKILTSECDLNDFGRLLNHTWNLKRDISMGISSDFIDDIYNKALQAGALGGKLLGAGGGGFLLFYVEKDKKCLVKKALENILYVPFQFENSGTKVIFYNS
jgi:D-glycero-alpha-D-manno-heptose-7-phosphate kinase